MPGDILHVLMGGVHADNTLTAEIINPSVKIVHGETVLLADFFLPHVRGFHCCNLFAESAVRCGS